MCTCLHPSCTCIHLMVEREKERNLGTQLEHRPARFKTHWCVLYQAVVLYVHASRSVNCGGILPVGRSGSVLDPSSCFPLTRNFTPCYHLLLRSGKSCLRSVQFQLCASFGLWAFHIWMTLLSDVGHVCVVLCHKIYNENASWDFLRRFFAIFEYCRRGRSFFLVHIFVLKG